MSGANVPEPAPAASSEPVGAAPPPENAVPVLPPPAERTSSAYSFRHEDPARQRDKVIGTIIVAVAFVLSLGISLWAKHASRPEVSDPPGPPTREGVIGYPSKVDVVATLPAARALTKRSMLRGITADGVRSDGTIDLSEGPGRVKYSFQSPPGQGPQPPREPGTLPRQLYCGKQVVQLRKEGLVADPDKPEITCLTRPSEPLPDPECSMKEVWARAIAHGAPADRLAKIEYIRAHAGPAWRFEIGNKHKLVLYGDCQRELSGPDAQAINN